MVRYNNDLDEFESHYYSSVETSDNAGGGHERHSRRGGSGGARSHTSMTSAEENFFRKEDLPTAGHALSGALSNALGNLLIYPVNTVSTRLKVQRHAMALRFEREEILRRKGGQKEKEKDKRKRRASSPSSSSSSSDDEVKGIFNVSKGEEQRYKMFKTETKEGTVIETWEHEYESNDEELYESHFDAFRKIYEREGIAGFYHGAGWDTAGHVVNGFWYFMAYTALRKQRLYILGHRTKTALPVMEELTLGIAAAALSGLASAPFSNIVTRKQTHAMLYPGAKQPSFADIFHDIMREKGITGFWSGYAASLLLTFNPSITFLLYEAVKPHAVLHKGADLDKFDMFMLAAACKAAATTLMYPLNIVRIRSQMEDGSEEWEGMIEATTSTKGIHISKGKHHSKGSSSQYKRTIRQASGIVEMMSEIVKREGFGALYVGLGGSLFKGFFTHGVNMMIKEQVHRFVLRLYFFVLDAYNHSEYGSFREKVLGETLHGANKVSHAVESGRRRIDSAKEEVRHVGEGVRHVGEGVRHAGERVLEKAHLGHNNHSHHNHSHSQQSHRDEHKHEHRASSRERMIEGRREEDRVRGWTEEEMFEERFVAPRERERERDRVERTTIREEHITTSGAPRRNDGTFRDERIREERITGSGEREASFREDRIREDRIREERITGEREASRHRHAAAAAAAEHNRTAVITKTQQQQQQSRMNQSTAVALSTGSLVGSPPVPLAKSMEKVAVWRNKVAEETAMAAAAVAAVNNNDNARVTTRHDVFEGPHGERIDRTITTRDTTIDHRRPPPIHRRVMASRDHSQASGQTYRSAAGNTGRTSLMVHPPSSVRDRIIGQREDWVDDSRRRMMGGGDVGVNGEVRRSIEGKTSWK